MDRRNSRRSYNDEPSNLKQRRFSQFDRNGESDRFESALNGVTKKFKGGDNKFVNATKDDMLEIDCKNEKIKLVNDVKTDGNDENKKVEDFRISQATRDHLKGLGITHLFPIQSATFDHIFEESDLIGRDRTGSGKTLSYVLPICENFRTKGVFKNRNGQKPLCLVILPTRELVIQVTNVFNTIKYMDDEFRALPIYGGTEIRGQIMDIKRGAEVLVGTPGRIMDLMERGIISFGELKVVVLDEADQMLDMGFQEDIEKIYQSIHSQISKEKLQSILLSATLPSWVHEVSRKYLREADLIKIDLIKDKGYKTATNIKHLAINCPYFSRNGAIGDIVLCYGGQHARTIIFTETKKEANDIMLEAHIKQECQVLHGDIPQKQREITFRAFREGKFKCLIATNVAARGLDIPEVDLIIQLSPPKEVDTYIHRSGRTARAGRTGVCVTFYMKKQLDCMDRIERQANFKFQKVGAPQPTDIIKANARDIVTSIKKVPHEVVGLFEDIVGELIDNIGAKEALSRALAIISGTNEKFKQRSLLCSIEGFITYVVETDVEFRNLAFIWTFLKRYFSAEITDSIKGMRAYQTKRGAAFDVPEQFEEDIQNFIESNPVTKAYTLKKIDALPELEEEGGNVRGGASFGGNGGGYGNSRVIKGRDDVKVFVGGLAYDSTEQHLQDFFRSEGVTPADVLVLRDNDGKSRGVSFVIFNSREDAIAATRSNGKRLQGRALRINMASDKPGGNGHGGRR